MKTLAMLAVSGIKPMSASGVTWYASPVNEGGSIGISAGTLVGAVYPITVRLKHSGSTTAIKTQVLGSGGLPFGDIASRNYNGNTLSVEVTDAAGRVLTITAPSSLTVHWIDTPSFSASPNPVPVGQVTYLFGSYSANPAPTIQWYYKNNNPPGAWTLLSSGSINTSSGGYSAGDSFSYYLRVTNAAGVKDSATLTVNAAS